MASCPHCRASLVEPAVFCGVCGARLGSGTDRPSGADDPAATRQLDAPAAATQPMQTAAPPSPPATTSDRPGDSLMRAVQPHWKAPVGAALAVVAVLAAGWLGSRALRGSSTGSGDHPARPIAIVESDRGADDTGEPSAIRPVPRRVARGGGHATLVALGQAAAGSAGGTSPEQLQPAAAPSTAAPPVVAPGAAGPAPGVPAVAAPGVPVAAPPPAAAAAPLDAAAAGALSREELEAAARYMKGEESVPPSAEDLADRDQAEGYAGSIRMVVKTHTAQVSACYERAFKVDAPAHAARVEIAFHVDKSGIPGNVRTASNTSGSEALANCLAQRVSGWRFPRPPGGQFDAVYPFTFSGAR